MELFRDDGCLSQEGLQALVAGQLDQLGRLEAAEHLAYCDKCMDRYTALLTDDVLEQPPRSARGAVMTAVFVQLMQNTWGRAAVAAVAAVLALTLWRSGTVTQILEGTRHLETWMPSTSQTQPDQPDQLPLLGQPVQDDERRPAETGPLGQPAEDKKPAKTFSEKLSGALDGLLFGKHESTAKHDAAVSNQTK